MRNNVSLKQIVEELGGELRGDPALMVDHVGSLAMAREGAISFFNDTKYSQQLSDTSTSAVILRPEHATLSDLPAILTDNPYAYFAKVSQLLNPVHETAQGVHATATVDESVHLPTQPSIAAHVVIEEGVTLAEHVVIGAGCVIGRDVVIGEGTVLEANVTIKHGTIVGRHCHFFSGAVIGNDGFGYAESSAGGEQHWEKIPQVGRTVIKDYVDIGANTTVDRGAIDDTVIEEGVKIDNLVQVAHNCRIGAHTVIAGCVGIAGSAVVGAHCKVGGAAMILGHLHIADNVTISPGSMITRSIRKPGTYTALMPFQAHDAWLKTAANIRHLERLTDKIKILERKLAQLEDARTS